MRKNRLAGPGRGPIAEWVPTSPRIGVRGEVGLMALSGISRLAARARASRRGCCSRSYSGGGHQGWRAPVS
jgi:hypothetical protein